jgi:hypothetical protein
VIHFQGNYVGNVDFLDNPGKSLTGRSGTSKGSSANPGSRPHCGWEERFRFGEHLKIRQARYVRVLGYATQSMRSPTR